MDLDPDHSFLHPEIDFWGPQNHFLDLKIDFGIQQSIFGVKNPKFFEEAGAKNFNSRARNKMENSL